MRIVGAVVLVVGALVGGCSSGDGPCALRKGSFAVSYAERSGNCGRRVEQVVNAEQAADAPGKNFSPDAPCTGSIKNTTDNCKTAIDITCPEPGVGAGYTSKSAGSYTFDSDATEATGVESLTVYRPGGVVECSSSYDVTYRKQ